MSTSHPHFAQSTHPSTIPGETLATYHWPAPTSSPLAAIFLVHGFRGNLRFNYLRSDSPFSLHNYGDAESSSFIRELNIRNFAVHGHDHVGHGASTGLRAYFPSFRALVDDLLSYAKRVDERMGYTSGGVPMYLMGHSMGGTVAIIACRDHKDVFQGMALSSAASEPPASMFGLMGRIQAAMSGITSTLIPTVQLVELPKSTDVALQEIFESDSLNASEVKVRARVGREFLNAYKDIQINVGRVETSFLTISGDLDTLVNPEAAKRFYEGAKSQDKKLEVAEGRWHNLLAEKGREELWEMIAEWFVERAKKIKDDGKQENE